jgi:hypothetical protein
MKKDVRDNILVEGLAKSLDWHIENATEKDYYVLLKKQLLELKMENAYLHDKIKFLLNNILIPSFTERGSTNELFFGSKDKDQCRGELSNLFKDLEENHPYNEK